MGEEGHRQANQRHPKPRRNGRALHRQDRYADDGPRHPRAVLRRRAAEDEGVLALAYQQPLPNRPQERAGPRGTRARETPCAPYPQNTRRWTKFPSISSVASCRSWSERPKAKTESSARGPGGDFPRCAAFELDGKLFPMENQHIDETQPGVRATQSDGFGCWPSPIRTLEPRTGAPDELHAVRQGRRVRPHPQRIRRLPRPAEGHPPTAISALQNHGVTVKVVTGDNDLVARKICKEVGLAMEYVLLGASRGDDDEELADAAERRPCSRVFLPRTSSASSRRCSLAGTRSASWGTASTTLRRCTQPTWASASTPPWTSPRNRRT